jgi:hypothetical protein
MELVKKRDSAVGTPDPRPLSTTSVDSIHAQNSLTQPQQLQRRKEEYDLLQEQRMNIKSALANFDALNKDQLDRLESDIRKLSMGGHQSEPTTPPEYSNGNGYSNGVRSNRQSIASMVSTPGFSNITSPRTGRSGSQSFSTQYSQSTNSNLPSYSLPQSRRGSDEEEDSFSNLNLRTSGNNTISSNRRPNG